MLLNQYSLLGHVAPSLTSQLENLATESLLYLLHRYTTAHEAFVEVVSTTGYVVPSDLEFSTQVRMQHGSIPDLVGTTTDGTGVLLVESKFWAPLTSNQPTGYLQRLPADGDGMVLFIAPEGRSEELWQQLMARCQREGLELSDEMAEPPNWRTARAGGAGHLAYASWSFVLDRLEGRLEEAGEERGAHEVWQLQSLCKRLEEPPGSSSDELRSIVDELARRLSQRGIFDMKGYRATPGPGYYRRYGTVLGHANWFVEYNTENAARFEESVLWLGDSSGELAARELSFDTEGNAPRFYKLNKEVLFPLDVPIQAARGLVVESLVTQVDGIVKFLWRQDQS